MKASEKFQQLLWAPLRYACANHFAHLSTVRHLAGPLQAALEVGKQEALPAFLLDALQAELACIDSPSTQQRKASLLRVLDALVEAGIALPEGMPRPVLKKGSNPQKGNLQKTVGSKKEVSLQREVEKAEPPKVTAASPASSLHSSLYPPEAPWNLPLQSLAWKCSPKLLAGLKRKEKHTVGDILICVPKAYEDRRHISRIAELKPNHYAVVLAQVTQAELMRRRGQRRGARVSFADDSGKLCAVHFHAVPWLLEKYQVGKWFLLFGQARHTLAGWEMTHPEAESAEQRTHSQIHFGRFVPIYVGFEKHEQRMLRELVSKLLHGFISQIQETLTESLKAELGLMDLKEAWKQLHFPAETETLEALNAAKTPMHRRLAFDELFFLQLGLAMRRQGIARQEGIAFKVSSGAKARMEQALPFVLTSAQECVVAEIWKDMQRKTPMNRLLQGDVGSGKTAVAMLASATCALGGHQAAVMAPTELLARQHAATFAPYVERLGIRMCLLTGGMGQAERRPLLEGISKGDISITIGTHALLQADLKFQSLGLVVVDEQHRFGVLQRHHLAHKGTRPDVLVMTATPIPRTLAMAVYGDLEVSTIDALPPGRKPISTRVFLPRKHAQALKLLQEELDKGRQAYVVFPLVEESEKMDLADATQGAQKLERELRGARIGLLHGRLKPQEKEEVMGAFRRGHLNVLVSTSIVEVGVDVPNATLMFIQAAERFGLSQLHQLRGRIGRSNLDSFCFLMVGGSLSKDAAMRLKTMEKTQDGFVVAQADLELRGPGEFLGIRQSGVPELRVANLARDMELLVQAKAKAFQLLQEDPSLEHHPEIARVLKERWGMRLLLAHTG
ncbi:MAG: ATP-dependent DNA helicase RecG [Cystobacterineae bacterium]|nr:ATP-dependent DNA helicase RecG [Cystobacterineae bacterium]